MKIVIIGGFSKSLINFREALIDDLIKKNHNVIAISPKDIYFDESSKILRQKGVLLKGFSYHRKGTNLFKIFEEIISIVKLLLELKPDIVFPYTFKVVFITSCSSLILKKFSKFKKFKLIGMITGLGEAYPSVRDSIFSKFKIFLIIKVYKFAFSSIDSLIFQNKDDIEYLTKLKSLPKSIKVNCVSGSGVDLNLFPFKQITEKKSFLMICRFIKKKGFKEYIDAARIIKHEFPNVNFKLAGTFDKRKDAITQKELIKLCQMNKVEYLGNLKNVLKELHLCQCFVLPSYYREGIPRVCLEALACGRPIITTNSVGCRETVIEGYNGFLVSPKDVNALAYKLKKFINISFDEKKIMSQNSYLYAKKRFDVEKINKLILNILLN